ncbi:MAG TPA: hypothetical protein VMY35_19450 [Phycisphaerae bacterium]|nr:hypothetical protein [Phycisphaerae bacterium]
MAGINDVLCGGDPEAVAELIGSLDRLVNATVQQIEDLPDTVDREVVVQARRALFHARCIVDLVRGGPGGFVSGALTEFSYHWRPRVLEVCGGNEQRVTIFIVEAVKLAMRLGLSFDDLVTEDVPGL